MIFKCSRTDLIKALNIVSKAVSAKTTMPVLKGIMIDATDEYVVFSASDLDISIQTSIPSEIEEHGKTVVPSKLFMDLSRKLPDETVTISESDMKITVKSGKAKSMVIGMDPSEFPNVYTGSDTDKSMPIDGDVFSDMVRKTSFSASPDDSRGILTGVLLEFDSSSFNMVALDSFRMALARTPYASAESNSVVINSRFLNDVSKIISENSLNEKIFITIEASRVIIAMKDTSVAIRLMEGEYVKYRDILRKTENSSMIVDRAELLEGIDRASLFSNDGKNNLVSLSIDDGNLTITSKSEEGNVKEDIYVENTGESIDISFNSKYVIDVLKAVGDDKVKFIFNDSVTPCIIIPVEGDYFEYLVLPVRVAVN